MENKWKTLAEMLAELNEQYGPIEDEEIYTMVSSNGN
jgi:hypothetical protein